MLAVRAAAFLLTAGMAGGGGAYLTGQHQTLPHPPGRSGPLTAEIDRQATDPHIRTAMRLGALLEGGNLTGPWRCGDHGWSCGPFQINRTVHDIAQARTETPRTAVAYMLPAYRAGCATVPAVRWRVDPRGSAAACVFRAEHPAAMYSARRVRAAWAQIGR